MLPMDLDISGWELRKTLRLFAGCNLSFNEWLGSPVIYQDTVLFQSRLLALMPLYFNPGKAIYHYYRIAENKAESLKESNTINCKKLFYILRPLLACQWIKNKCSMPPTLFKELLHQQNLPDELLITINELQIAKANTLEDDSITMPDHLAAWIMDTFQSIHQNADSLSVNSTCNWQPLNALMQEWILDYSKSV